VCIKSDKTTDTNLSIPAAGEVLLFIDMFSFWARNTVENTYNLSTDTRRAGNGWKLVVLGGNAVEIEA
jgi:hypothetical protein